MIYQLFCDITGVSEFNDVQAIQAGGVLVYAPLDAKYHWTLEQATQLPVYETENPVAGLMKNIAKGTVVGNSTTEADDATKLAQATESDTNYYGAIDASTFTPETTGLYIFRRDIKDTEDGTENTYEYSGYYYESTLGKYFALHTGTDVNGKSEYVLPADAVTEKDTATPSKDQVLPVTVSAGKVYLFTATETVVDTAASGNDKLVWTYDGSTGSEKFTVHYEGNTSDSATFNDDIDITVNLANITTNNTDAEKWKAFGTGALTTFYYNNDLEAGDTTAKLVDSVVLSDATKKEAYLAFDFDLNVYLESAQVTLDENGKEMTTAVKSWAATTVGSPATAINTGAKTGDTGYAAVYDPSDSEIKVAGWSALS